MKTRLGIRRWDEGRHSWGKLPLKWCDQQAGVKQGSLSGLVGSVGCDHVLGAEKWLVSDMSIMPVRILNT